MKPFFVASFIICIGLSACGGRSDDPSFSKLLASLPSPPPVTIPDLKPLPPGNLPNIPTGNDCEDVRDGNTDEDIMAACYKKLGGKIRTRRTSTEGTENPDCYWFEAVIACRYLKKTGGGQSALCKTSTWLRNECKKPVTREWVGADYHVEDMRP